MSLLDETTSVRPKEEFLRLAGVELIVPTEEQLAKAAATASVNGTTVPAPRARLHLTWEPLSYNIKGANGNVTHDFIDVSFGLEPEDLDRVRSEGWLGIPDRRLVRVDEKLGAEGQTREWPRYRLRTRDVLHLDIDRDGSITGKRGQPYSQNVGQVFRCTEGSDAFAKLTQKNGAWVTDGLRTAFMRYPLENVTDTYVAPANPPIRIPRVTSTATAGSVVSNLSASNVDALRAAVVASGLVGMAAIDLSTMSKQVNFISRHMEDTPETLVLGTAEVNEAASNGDLLEYFTRKGVITVTDEGVIA